MSIDDEALARLRKMLAGAPRLPWMLATSNSWRRVLTEMGNERVIVPCVDHDGHPNMDDYANIALAVAAVNALPALLDIAEAVARAPVGVLWEATQDTLEIAGLGADDYRALIGKRVRIVPCTGGAE